MSDTDDTDLLLLIPPDFFLVPQSEPDLDSDSDINFSYNHNQVKDSIVSDLITQVNDLESRICMIENVDRSVTHCSSCIEDSFITQSVNSLTESDILRAQLKTILPEKLAFQTLDVNHIHESFESSNIGSKSLTEEHLSDPNKIKKKSVTIDSIETQTPDYEYRPNNDNEIRNEGILGQLKSQSGSFLHKEDKKGLLQEIDNFLEVKKGKNNYNLNSIKTSENFNELLCDSGKRDLLVDSDGLLSEENNIKLHTEEQEQRQSLSLPRVFELLHKMEQTQHEIENKLNYREPEFQSNRTNPNISALNTVFEDISKNKTNVQIAGFETNHTSLILNKQSDNVHERLMSLAQSKYQTSDNFRTDSSNSQLSYLLKPNVQDESTPNKESKVSSPKRSSLESNPGEIVISNFQKKSVRSPSVNFEKKELSGRVSSSRRLFNFEHNYGSPNQTNLGLNSAFKSDEVKTNISSNPQMNGRVSVNLPSNSTSTQSFNIAGKHNYVGLSTEKTTVNKSNYTETYKKSVENKPSGIDNLQQKLSSNNLLSLSELWNKEPSFYSDDPNKLRQKLEEEKYRRQHCEQEIQALQLRVLEEQERLAVAIKVDQEKDRAILQMTESWRKLNNHWGELEEQRHGLEQQLHDEKELSKVKTSELTKKVERWEKEVSQALDLAAGYKEKCESVQKEMELLKKNTEEKLAEADSQLFSLNRENEKISEENKHLLNQLDGFRARIEEEERLLSKLKTELEKSKKKCSEYEAEINVLKEQKETLTNKIRDEKGRNNVLEQQNKALQQAFNEASKKEKAAQDEARVSTERIEVARTELRALYQGQLEAVVKEKLQEFQCQLEAAEAALKAELLSKEKQWQERANEQCRQLQEKHKIDLYKKDESCKNEITKWRMKLMESEKIRSISEGKLQDETNRRADIAHRLHSVMETQWREALNIISNPMQNVYEATKEDGRNKWSNAQSAERLRGNGDARESQSHSTTNVSQAEDAPFCREGLETCRPEPQQDHQLKKYIQMLLERGPGNPVLHDSLQESLNQTFAQDNNFVSRYMLENTKRAEGLEKLLHSSKPPWK